MLRIRSRFWLVVFGVVFSGALLSGIGGLVGVVRGQDSVGEEDVVSDGAEVLLGEIAEVRKEVFLAEAGSEGRGKLIEKLLLLRRKLVKDFSDDIRVSSWEGDLAFDLLFVAGVEGGLDLEVEFGVVSEAMREKYHGYAVEAHELADDAIAGAGDRVLDLEDSDGFNDDVKLQQERRRLVQMEVRRRLPFLFAAAGYAVAVSTVSDEDVRNYYQEVIDSGLDLDLMLDDPWRSRMRVMSALARLRLGDFEGGGEVLGWVKFGADVDKALRFRVLIGRLMIGEAEGTGGGGGRGGVDGRADFDGDDPQWLKGEPFYSLIRCDHELRLRMEIAAEQNLEFATEGDRWQWLAGAYERFLDNDELGLPRGARERVVGEHMARVIPEGVGADEVPAIVILARAEGVIEDAEKRGEVGDRLRELIARDDVAEWVRPRAIYLYATAYLFDNNLSEAAREFIMVAELYPESADAENAIEQAFAILSEEGGLNSEGLSDDEGVLFEKLNGLVKARFREMKHFDEWMFRWGEYELMKEDYDAAVEAFDAVGEGTSLYGPALVESAQARRAQGIHALEKQTGAGEGDSVEARKYFAEAIAIGLGAHEVLMPLMKRGLEEGATDDMVKEAFAVLAVITADAQLRSGHAGESLQVIEDYQKMLPTGSIRESSQFAELLLLRVKSLAALGKSDEADGEVRTLAEEAPARALDVLRQMVGSIHDELRKMENAGLARLVVEKKAKARLLPMATLANDLAARDGGGGLDENITIRYQYAEALRLSGEIGRARGLLEVLRKERPDSAEVAASYAECCYQSGDDATAMREFGRVSSAFKAQRNEMFWFAEARMLQILDRTGHQKERIFARIQRLRKYDQSLGGGRSKRILEGLEKKYSP